MRPLLVLQVLTPPTVCAPGDKYLGEWSEATWELLVLLTTANFPKVMMPAYTASRGYALFFVLYVCFGTFFLLNYVLAVVYSAYTHQERLVPLPSHPYLHTPPFTPLPTRRARIRSGSSRRRASLPPS